MGERAADAAVEAIEEALTGLVPAYWAAPGDLARVALGALVASPKVRLGLGDVLAEAMEAAAHGEERSVQYWGCAAHSEGQTCCVDDAALVEPALRAVLAALTPEEAE